MNLYLVSQNYNSGYDTYDSMIIAAKNEKEAKTISIEVTDNPTCWVDNLDQLEVEKIGKANPETESGLILASFNAG